MWESMPGACLGGNWNGMGAKERSVKHPTALYRYMSSLMGT